MPDLRPTQIEVYVFRRRAGRVEFLCLKRAARERLPGVWQPVTGTLRRGEGALAGAAREVREETGLDPGRWWALEGVGIYFHPPTGQARVMAMFDGPRPPMTRAEIDVDHVRLLGDVAVVTGRSVSEGRVDGKDVSVTQRYTDVYVKRNGRWQVVASQGTEVK